MILNSVFFCFCDFWHLPSPYEHSDDRTVRLKRKNCWKMKKNRRFFAIQICSKSTIFSSFLGSNSMKKKWKWPKIDSRAGTCLFYPHNLFWTKEIAITLEKIKNMVRILKPGAWTPPLFFTYHMGGKYASMGGIFMIFCLKIDFFGPQLVSNFEKNGFSYKYFPNHMYKWAG